MTATLTRFAWREVVALRELRFVLARDPKIIAAAQTFFVRALFALFRAEVAVRDAAVVRHGEPLGDSSGGRYSIGRVEPSASDIDAIFSAMCGRPT